MPKVSIRFVRPQPKRERIRASLVCIVLLWGGRFNAEHEETELRRTPHHFD